MAKPQNVPLSVVLALFSLRLRAWQSAALIGAAAVVSILTIPPPTQRAATYNQIFMAIVPDSTQPAADLQSLGLPPDLVRYSRTGAWSAGTAFTELETSGLIGARVTPATILRFYLSHPGRIWRRARAVLPVAFSLRPTYGNFERSAGHPPGATSSTFSLWSAVHERYFIPCGKMILIALLIAPILIAAAWRRLPGRRKSLEFLGVLTVCCVLSFVVAICGDAYDNVKHLFLFNVLLDTWLFALVGQAVT
jgi:hypothetical protein